MRRPVALGILLLAAMPALASEGEAARTVLGMPQWVALTINLIIFIGIIVYFAGPALVRFLEAKSEEIRHALAEAQRQREEAEQMEARLTGKIEELEREVEELSARAESEGERERQEILAETERDATRLQQQTRAQIDQRVNQARQELTQHAVDLAAKLAQEKLADQVTESDRRRLFDDNLARLEKK